MARICDRPFTSKNAQATPDCRQHNFCCLPSNLFRVLRVLVSDIGLPDGSGVELMQKVKAQRPIFGIALTGFGMEEDLRRSRDVGFHHHLIKPVDLNKLDALIQQAASRTEEVGAQA